MIGILADGPEKRPNEGKTWRRPKIPGREEEKQTKSIRISTGLGGGGMLAQENVEDDRF